MEKDEVLILCSECGFPMKTVDTSLIVQSYFSGCGKIIKRLKNDLLDIDSVQCFLQRSSSLTVRLCKRIKCCRAKVSPKIINYFYDNPDSGICTS